MNEYRIAVKTYPARVVVHKSSNFDDSELSGLKKAGQDLKIDAIDFVTVLDSKLRLLRNGNYPPYRGTLLHVEDERLMLYTRGSVWYYGTYTGIYVPRRSICGSRKPKSHRRFSREILGLTKMNWNNTQFDGKYPVTLGCARKPGEILKYLREQEVPIRYAYYM